MMDDIREVLGLPVPLDQAQLSFLSTSALKKALNSYSRVFSTRDLQTTWEKLVQTCLDPIVGDKHLTASCNCLSVLLINAAASPDPEIRAFIFQKRVWFEGYACAWRGFSDGKTKPALQVLETLLLLLAKYPDRIAASDIQRESIAMSIDTIITGHPRQDLKLCCIVLSCYLRKTELRAELETVVETSLKQVSSSWVRHQNANNVCPDTGSASSSSIGVLLLALLFAVRNLETRSASLKAIVQICNGEGGEARTALAAEAFQTFIRANSDSLGDFADNVLPVILDDHERYETFLKVYQIKPGCMTEQMLLYLSVLRVGRLNKIVAERDLPTTLNDGFIDAGIMSDDNTEPYLAFEWLLRTSDTALRLHAYDLLSISSATHTAIPVQTLECISRSLKHLHNENDAYERGELLAVTRRLLHRVENGKPELLTSQVWSQSPTETTWDQHVRSDFNGQLVQFLTSELGPGISYSRHILALQTLQLIPDVNVSVEVNGNTLLDSLLSLVLDPFNDVREASAHLIKRLATQEVSADAGLLLPLLCQRLGSLSARSGRQDHADAAGRLGAAMIPEIGAENSEEATEPQAQDANNITQLLARRVSAMDELTPGTSFTLHGTILALVHYFNDLNVDGARAGKLDCDSVITACQKLWILVQSVLCIDSPERGTEQEIDDATQGPKDLLAYSWRALRDLSLLLQAILRHEAERYGLIHNIGELCLDQLIKLRHRGAFSTVAQTFAMSCEKARTSAVESNRALVRRWYQVASEQLDVQSQQLTRRSAGLPAIFNAILSASDPTFFRSVVQELSHKASLPTPLYDQPQGPPSLPQVHALNCLKDIMTNSKFRAVSEQHVSVMLDIAATSLTCPIWAIRNCGLMLMRACMTRMATASVPIGSGIGTTRGPLDIVTDLLERALPQTTSAPSSETAQQPGTYDQDLVSENIFAALELVRHIEQGRQQNERVRKLIEMQLGNRIWAIRDHTARVLAEILSADGETVNLDLFSSATRSSSQNTIHGYLLLLRYRLSSAWQDTVTQADNLAQQTIDAVLREVSKDDPSTWSSYTFGALLDVFNDCLLQGLSADQRTEDLLRRANNISQFLGHHTHSTFCQDRVLLCRTLLHLTKPTCNVTEDESLECYLVESLASRPDSAAYVLRNLTETRTHLWHHDLQQFFCRLIVRAHTSDTKALAMTVLVGYLEAAATQLDPASVHELEVVVDLNEVHDRNLQDATMRLQSHMFRTTLKTDRKGPDASSLAVIKRWLHVLQTASHNALDLPTRLNAARALRSCASSLMRSLVLSKSQDSRDAQVDLISILYDQLNDDDEEIRFIAQETAYQVMGDTGSKHQWSLPLSSLAARQQLVDLLGDGFYDDSSLVRLCLVRLVGISLEEVLPSQVNVNIIFRLSIAERLRVICLSMDDLFAEERQNLYVDELEEIEVWSNLLHKCRFSNLAHHWVQAVLDWTSEGLDVVMAIVRSRLKEPEDTKSPVSKLARAHPQGPTYHQDLLELCLRVIKMAGLVGHARLLLESTGANDKASVDQDSIRRKLQVLQADGGNTRLHHKVVQALADLATE